MIEIIESHLLRAMSLILLVMSSSPAFSSELPIFAVVRANELQKLPAVQGSSCVNGVTLYWSWRMLEPSKGDFDLRRLDEVLTALEKKNTPVNLAVLPGRWSPAWLRDDSVKYMEWAHADAYVEDGRKRESTAPIPWDEHYLSRLELLFEHVVPLVKSHKNVVSLAITGPSNTNGLETAIVGDDSELGRVGFDRNKVVASWVRLANKIKSLGGNFKLTVALHERYGSKRIPDIGRQIDSEMRAILGERYVPMLLGFEGKPWFAPGNGYADLIMRGGRADGALQAIRRYSGSEGRAGLLASMRRAEELKARWYEVWVDDVVDGLLPCDK